MKLTQNGTGQSVAGPRAPGDAESLISFCFDLFDDFGKNRIGNGTIQLSLMENARLEHGVSIELTGTYSSRSSRYRNQQI